MNESALFDPNNRNCLLVADSTGKFTRLIKLTEAGGLPVDLTGKIAGEDIENDVLKVEFRNKYFGISAAASTLVKDGAGVLRSITVAGGTLGAVTVYDNNAGSGPKIVDSFTPVAGQNLLFDVEFATGLFIVTAAATVLTVSYR